MSLVFIITNAGVAVGKIVPLDSPRPSLQITRPAKRVGSWTHLGFEPKDVGAPLVNLIDDVRQERA